jgi:hypothetical protein
VGSDFVLDEKGSRLGPQIGSVSVFLLWRELHAEFSVRLSGFFSECLRGRSSERGSKTICSIGHREVKAGCGGFGLKQRLIERWL